MHAVSTPRNEDRLNKVVSIILAIEEKKLARHTELGAALTDRARAYEGGL